MSETPDVFSAEWRAENPWFDRSPHVRAAAIECFDSLANDRPEVLACNHMALLVGMMQSRFPEIVPDRGYMAICAGAGPGEGLWVNAMPPGDMLATANFRPYNMRLPTLDQREGGAIPGVIWLLPFAPAFEASSSMIRAMADALNAGTIVSLQAAAPWMLHVAARHVPAPAAQAEAA